MCLQEGLSLDPKHLLLLEYVSVYLSSQRIVLALTRSPNVYCTGGVLLMQSKCHRNPTW